MDNILKKFRDSRGQGLTEYIIIVALIAIAAIGVITLFGENIRKLFGASVNALAGETNVNPGTKKHKLKNVTLKEFGKKNAAKDVSN